jgi:hypothetical protein
MSRLPHFLHNRSTDGGKVVRLTRRPPFTPGKIPGTHFYQRLSRSQGHSAAKIEKSNGLIGNRTRDLPACSTVPQRSTLPRAQDGVVWTSLSWLRRENSFIALLVNRYNYRLPPLARQFFLTLNRINHLNNFFTLSHQPHYGPGVDSASDRNEYQEFSWGGKGRQD